MTQDREPQAYRVEGDLHGEVKVKTIMADSAEVAGHKFLSLYPEVVLTSVHAAWDWDF